MTDPNRPNDDAAKAAPTGEPVVSKPYIMPDDPEEGSVEALTKELADARDKTLRTLAEMENLRQRTRREVADSKTYGISGFARDILDIADNLQRALDAIPAEAKETADPGIKAFIEGVELTERSSRVQCCFARRGAASGSRGGDCRCSSEAVVGRFGAV